MGNHGINQSQRGGNDQYNQDGQNPLQQVGQEYQEAQHREVLRARNNNESVCTRLTQWFRGWLPGDRNEGGQLEEGIHPDGSRGENARLESGRVRRLDLDSSNKDSWNIDLSDMFQDSSRYQMKSSGIGNGLLDSNQDLMLRKEYSTFHEKLPFRKGSVNYSDNAE